MGIVCPGYRPPVEADFRFVDQTRYAAQLSGSMVVAVSSRHVNRAQLFSLFLDQFLPDHESRTGTNHFAFLARLPGVDFASPFLGTSVDALCMAQIGTFHSDERCIRES